MDQAQAKEYLTAPMQSVLRTQTICLQAFEAREHQAHKETVAPGSTATWYSANEQHTIENWAGPYDQMANSNRRDLTTDVMTHMIQSAGGDPGMDSAQRMMNQMPYHRE